MIQSFVCKESISMLRGLVKIMICLLQQEGRIFMSGIYTVNDIKDILLPVFDVTPVESAIIFGSYAKGNPTQNSDVDILIDSKGRIRGIDFFGILEDIIEALGVPVDLIEASQVIEGGRAQREIAETGVLIYERS